MASVCITLLLGCLAAAGSALDSLTYSIPEEEPPESYVGNIKFDANLIDDYSPAAYSRLTFHILAPVDGDDMFGNNFKVHNTSGDLNVRTPLDRDSSDYCKFQEDCVLNFDVAIGSQQLVRVITIRIRLLDINDNPPRFSSSEISLNISEMAGIGSSFQLPVVSDRDLDNNGVVQMSLSPINDHFKVLWSQPVSHQTRPRIELQKSLDREQISAFDLTVTAQDGGYPPQTAILLVHVDVIDANDNSPQFDQAMYDFYVAEDRRPGTRLPAVTATDRDSGDNGRVVYSLTESTLEQYDSMFSIGSNSGIITILSDLDRESQPVYDLRVVATDGGKDKRSTTATVTLHVEDVNDNTPHIRISALTTSGLPEISEDADIGTFVALLSVTDQDDGVNAHITCTVNTKDFHLVALQGNKYKLVTSVLLDREIKDSYEIEIFCHDNGIQHRSTTKTLSVHVLDANDHDPLFSHGDLTVHIQENTAPGALLGQVYATDNDIGENARITYSTAQKFSRYVHVNNATGTITTIARFDREVTSDFNIHVIARDHGDPARSTMCTVTVIVDDVNDNPPRFSRSEYTFLVPENEHLTKELGTVTATDPDESPYNRVEFTLLGPTSYFFSINPDNGTMYSIRPLDREVNAVLVVQVVASDAKNPALRAVANVSVYVSDVNDNTPVILFPSALNNTITINNRLLEGDFVAQVAAKDDDIGQNAALEYSLKYQEQSDKELFAIDRVTGTIEVKSDLADLHNVMVSCVLEVWDLGIPSLKTERNITIFINDSVEVIMAGLESEPSGLNMTIIIVVVATTIIVVVVLVIAIAFVLLKLRRNRKPAICIEKVAVSYDAKKVDSYKFDESNVKPVAKIFDPKLGRSTEGDRDSCGSADGSTTDSGRGASEEGDHSDRGVRHNDSTDTKMSHVVFPGADDSIVSSTYDFNTSYDHVTMPRRAAAKNKNVTFEDDVTVAEIRDPGQCRFTNTYTSCPTIGFVGQSAAPWIQTAPDDTHNSSIISNTAPRRTVRNVKAKDRNKKLDSLPGILTNSGPQHATNCPEYRKLYDFSDSSSLLRYKGPSGEGSTGNASEITDATSTTSATSGSYVIDGEDVACD